MVMLDFDYDETSQVFDLDAVFYGDAIRGDGGEVRFRADELGEKMMAVFIDIYGNESRVLIDSAKLARARSNNAGTRTNRKKAAKKATKKTATKKKAASNRNAAGKKTARKKKAAAK